MPWRRYLAEHSDLDHHVWIEWLRFHEFADMGLRKHDPYECIIGDGPDAHVSQETWERWEGKVAGAQYALMNQDQVLKKFAKEGDQEAINRLKAKGIHLEPA